MCHRENGGGGKAFENFVAMRLRRQAAGNCVYRGEWPITRQLVYVIGVV